MNPKSCTARVAKVTTWLLALFSFLPSVAAAQANLQSDLSAFKQRGHALEVGLNSPNQPTASKASVDYKAYVADFKEWAAKNRLVSHTRRVNRADLIGRPTRTVAQADRGYVPIGKPSTGCQWLLESATEQCVLASETDKVCEYYCVDIPAKGGGKVTTVDPNADPSKQ